MVEQCSKVKAINPLTKCFVYLKKRAGTNSAARFLNMSIAHHVRDWLMSLPGNTARGWTNETVLVKAELMEAVRKMCSSTMAQIRAAPDQPPDLFLLAVALVENGMADEAQLFPVD